MVNWAVPPPPYYDQTSPADMVRRQQGEFDAEGNQVAAMTAGAGATVTRPIVGDSQYFVGIGLHPLDMLAARLRLPKGSGAVYQRFAPLDFVNVAFSDDKAFITVIAHDKGSVIEDDAKNFPTDELVAQFRILLASQ